MSFARTAFLLGAAPLAWAAHFLAIYALTGLACARAAPGVVPWGVAVATIAAGALCVALIVRALRAPESFENGLAAALAAMALLAIAWEAVPALLLRPCV